MKNPNKNSIPYGPKQLPWEDQTPSWASVTGPIKNPVDLYDAVPPKGINGKFPKINYRKFEIPPEGLSKKEYRDAMAEFKKFIKTQHKRFTGYQTNEYLKDNDELSWLLNIHANNVGDPFTTGIFALNSKFVERSVLDYFAALWRAHWPFNGKNEDDIDYYWGYVMSMGSTEGNIYALYNGREYLSGGKLIADPDAKTKNHEKFSRNKFGLEKQYAQIRPVDYYEKPNKYKPIAFFSEDTHYSVIKGVSMCAVTSFAEEGRLHYDGCCPITDDGSWPDEVPSHNLNDELHPDDLNKDHPNSGTIIVKDLKKLVEFFVKREYPVIIVLNQGSTWKGAYDDVPAVNDMLKDLGEKYPWLWERNIEYLENKKKKIEKRRSFWLHIDGALGASYLPFLRMAQNMGKLEGKKVPEFDFSIKAVMSIVCSMHKWIGAPWPGGIYMTRRSFQINPPDTAGYIGSPDTTLGGSRNAFSPILFWKYFARNGYKKNIKRALKTERVAAKFKFEMEKLEDELQKRFPEDNVDLWIHRSELSLAVLFRKVNADITYKYTVDSERIKVPFKEDGTAYYEDRTFSHIYSMSSLGKYDLVEQLIGDIRKACKKDWKIAFPDFWKEEDGTIVKNPGEKNKIDAHVINKKG